MPSLKQRLYSNKSLFKLDHYIRSLIKLMFARQRCPGNIKRALSFYDSLPTEQRAQINKRVNYYNKLDTIFSADEADMLAANYTRQNSWTYHLDFKPLLACLPDKFRFNLLFGDITHIPEKPTFVKSRPVRKGAKNMNSVLLKLNKVRHYFMPTDPNDFLSKKPMAVWRGSAHRDKRKHFVELCYNKPMCDIGDVSDKSLGKPWHKEFMSISEQLKYRYILSVEGNDVSTNIKWIMASNSLCLMPKPEYETWFMEGSLKPGVHYIELKKDFSDLADKIAYYNANTDEALDIIQNANEYTRQFLDSRKEYLISLLVMDKYARLSGQNGLFEQGATHEP